MSDAVARETTEEWVARIETMYDGDPPDGWMIVHHRAAGSSSCHFGPFATLGEAAAWADAHPHVQGGFTPLYLNVDWSR